MRPIGLIGVILVVLGVIALAVPSITFFTTELNVADVGFFAIDVSKPHTIFFNPIVGGVALITPALILAVMGTRSKSA